MIMEREELHSKCVLLASTLHCTFGGHIDPLCFHASRIMQSDLAAVVQALLQTQSLPLELIPSVSFLASVAEPLAQQQYIEINVLRTCLYHLQIPPLDSFIDMKYGSHISQIYPNGAHPVKNSHVYFLRMGSYYNNDGTDNGRIVQHAIAPLYHSPLAIPNAMPGGYYHPIIPIHHLSNPAAFHTITRNDHHNNSNNTNHPNGQQTSGINNKNVPFYAEDEHTAYPVAIEIGTNTAAANMYATQYVNEEINVQIPEAINSPKAVHGNQTNFDLQSVTRFHNGIEINATVNTSMSANTTHTNPDTTNTSNHTNSSTSYCTIPQVTINNMIQHNYNCANEIMQASRRVIDINDTYNTNDNNNGFSSNTIENKFQHVESQSTRQNQTTNDMYNNNPIFSNANNRNIGSQIPASLNTNSNHYVMEDNYVNSGNDVYEMNPRHHSYQCEPTFYDKLNYSNQSNNFNNNSHAVANSNTINHHKLSNNSFQCNNQEKSAEFHYNNEAAKVSRTAALCQSHSGSATSTTVERFNHSNSSMNAGAFTEHNNIATPQLLNINEMNTTVTFEQENNTNLQRQFADDQSRDVMTVYGDDAAQQKSKQSVSGINESLTINKCSMLPVKGILSNDDVQLSYTDASNTKMKYQTVFGKISSPTIPVHNTSKTSPVLRHDDTKLKNCNNSATSTTNSRISRTNLNCNKAPARNIRTLSKSSSMENGNQISSPVNHHENEIIGAIGSPPSFLTLNLTNQFAQSHSLHANDPLTNTSNSTSATLYGDPQNDTDHTILSNEVYHFKHYFSSLNNGFDALAQFEDNQTMDIVQCGESGKSVFHKPFQNKSTRSIPQGTNTLNHNFADKNGNSSQYLSSKGNELCSAFNTPMISLVPTITAATIFTKSTDITKINGNNNQENDTENTAPTPPTATASTAPTITKSKYKLKGAKPEVSLRIRIPTTTECRNNNNNNQNMEINNNNTRNDEVSNVELATSEYIERYERHQKPEEEDEESTELVPIKCMKALELCKWFERMEFIGHYFDDKAKNKFQELCSSDPNRASGITSSFELRKHLIQNNSAWLSRACFNCKRKPATTATKPSESNPLKCKTSKPKVLFQKKIIVKEHNASATTPASTLSSLSTSPGMNMNGTASSTSNSIITATATNAVSATTNTTPAATAIVTNTSVKSSIKMYGSTRYSCKTRLSNGHSEMMWYAKKTST